MQDATNEKEITPVDARQAERVGLIKVLGISMAVAIAGILLVLVL